MFLSLTSALFYKLGKFLKCLFFTFYCALINLIRRLTLTKLSELCDLVLQIICIQITLVNDLMIRGALPPRGPRSIIFLLEGYHGENIFIFILEYEKEVR